MSRAVRCCCLLGFALLAPACDLRVGDGQTTVLGDRGMVFGVLTPNAVSVGRGGTLVVQDADAFGLGRRVEQGDALRPGPGAAIVVSDGGSVRALRGTISGGNVLVIAQDPATPPQPPNAAEQLFPTPLAPALMAQGASVEIDGANLVASGVFGSVGFVPAPAVLANQSQVRIRSGSLRVGPGTSSSPFFLALIALQAAESSIEISGGDFVGGRSLIVGSQTRISGGNVGSLSLGIDVALLNPMPLPSRGCTELRGGSLQSMTLDGPNETLIVFGTGFNLPLGPVPIPQLAMRRILVPPPPPTVRLTGRLADGTPLDLAIWVFDAAARIVLAAPGSATGC
jgi:hypothetical protein